MYIKVNAKELKEKLNSIAYKKPRLPILDNIILDAKKGVLYTNLDWYLNLHVNAETPEEGAVCVSLPALRKIIKNMKGEVEFQQMKDKLNIINAGNMYVYADMTNTEEYPMFPEIFESNTPLLTMPTSELKDVIRKLKTAISTEDSRRWTIQSILIDTKEKNFVSTDGRRMHINKMGKEVDIHNKAEIIVPIESIKALEKTLKIAKDNTIGIYTDAKHVLFSTSDFNFATRFIEETYPRYLQYLPKDNPNTLMINKYAFEITKNIRFVKLILTEDAVELKTFHSVRAEDQPEISKTIEKAYNGEKMGVVLDTKFLWDILNACSSKTVLMQIRNNKSPLLFIDGEDKYVLMPMKED